MFAVVCALISNKTGSVKKEKKKNKSIIKKIPNAFAMAFTHAVCYFQIALKSYITWTVKGLRFEKLPISPRILVPQSHHLEIQNLDVFDKLSQNITLGFRFEGSFFF